MKFQRLCVAMACASLVAVTAGCGGSSSSVNAASELYQFGATTSTGAFTTNAFYSGTFIDPSNVFGLGTGTETITYDDIGVGGTMPANGNGSLTYNGTTIPIGITVERQTGELTFQMVNFSTSPTTQKEVLITGSMTAANNTTFTGSASEYTYPTAGQPGVIQTGVATIDVTYEGATAAAKR